VLLLALNWLGVKGWGGCQVGRGSGGWHGVRWAGGGGEVFGGIILGESCLRHGSGVGWFGWARGRDLTLGVGFAGWEGRGVIRGSRRLFRCRPWCRRFR
jgi:hypothetical protein